MCTHRPGPRSVCLHVCARGVPASPSSSHSPGSGPALPTPRQTAMPCTRCPTRSAPCRAGLGSPLVRGRSPGRCKSTSPGLCLCGGQPGLEPRASCEAGVSVCDQEAPEVGRGSLHRLVPRPLACQGRCSPVCPEAVSWPTVVAAIEQTAFYITHWQREGWAGERSPRPRRRRGVPARPGCWHRRACRANFMADNTLCSQDFTDK